MDGCIPREECNACKELYDAKIDGVDGRLRLVEEDVKQIHALAISVEKMAVSIQHMTDELAKHGEKLSVIEAEPGNKWKQATWLVIAAVIGAAVSYLITHVGL